jgi:hypothetical protein
MVKNRGHHPKKKKEEEEEKQKSPTVYACSE